MHIIMSTLFFCLDTHTYTYIHLSFPIEFVGGWLDFARRSIRHINQDEVFVAVDLLSGNARVSNLQDVPFLRWFCQKAGGNLKNILKSTQNKVGPQEHSYKRGEGFNSYKVRVFPSPLCESFTLFQAIYMLSLVLEVEGFDQLPLFSI